MSDAGGTITVGQTPLPGVRELLSSIDEQRRHEIEREEKRSQLAKEIARRRWAIAKEIHRLEDGQSKLDFESRPFQKDILQDESTDVVFYGAAQGLGKTEIVICHAIASAGIAGLKVLWVISKKDKMETFVKSRLDPVLTSVPMYHRLMSQAKERGAIADNTLMKQIGYGSISFIFATANKNFTSFPADSIIIDEYQECDQNNLRMLDDRTSGNLWCLWWRIGHPTVAGTEENQNLDWLYQNSDRRIWKVPCPWCKKTQELTWEGHCVSIQRNKTGGILSILPRDKDWSPGAPLDMRAICDDCYRPMNRLTPEGSWDITQPGQVRHGYQLSNIPNANRRLSQLFDRFISARHSSVDLCEFYNKQLGKPFDLNAEKITEPMLLNCATGEQSKVPPYRFVPVTQMDWKRLMEKEAA